LGPATTRPWATYLRRNPITRERVHQALRSTCLALFMTLATLDDRLDNAANIRYDGYQKPYFATAPDGALILQGRPVPKSRQVYIRENWLVRHLWLARVAALATTEIRHPQL
jgi:hypothetical protein